MFKIINLFISHFFTIEIDRPQPDENNALPETVIVDIADSADTNSEILTDEIQTFNIDLIIDIFCPNLKQEYV